jgi:hypothetical protein
VNEFLGVDSPDVLNAAPAPPPPSGTIDEMDYPAENDDTSLAARREGLPPGFRMRHDKHYVEELMSTPIGPREAFASSVRPSVTVSDPLHDRRVAPPAPSQPSAAVIALIAERLGAIVAHNAVARPKGTAPDFLGRTVHAELERVHRLTNAVVLNSREAEPVRRAIPAGEIASAVRSACGRLARLYGTTCGVTADDPGFAVAVDRASIVDSLTGTVDALLELAHLNGGDEEAIENARITVSLQAVKVRPALIVDVECSTLAWRAGSADRFFDNGEQDFAVAPAAGILLASAAHVVRLHGGRVEAQVQGGVRVRYVLPQEKPRAIPGADA